MVREEILVERDGLAVIRDVPVGIGPIFRGKDSGMRLLGLRVQLQRAAGQRRGQRPVFPGALAVESCKQQHGAHIFAALHAFFLQKPFLRLKFVLCEKAPVLEHILDARKAALIRQGKERVNARAQHNRQRREQLYIRQRASKLPFTDGLCADVQRPCKLLLRHALRQTQRFDPVSHLHDRGTLHSF